MALATRCPHCNALFRVAAEQLRSRSGMVRCGACRQVFNAIAGLDYLDAQRLAADDSGTRNRPAPPILATPPLEPPPEPVAATTVALAAAPQATASTGWQPDPAPLAQTADKADTIASVAEPELPAAPEVVAPSAEAAQSAAPAPGAPGDRRRNPRAESGTLAPRLAPASSGRDASAEFQIAEAAPESPIADQGTDIDTLFEAPRDEASELGGSGDSAEPEAVPQPEAADAGPSFLLETEPQPIARGALIAGSALLLALLLAQLALIFRTPLVVAFPATRAALQALCAPLSCTASWPMRPDLLAVVSSELQAVPGTSVLELNTVLRSRAAFPLALPAIELTISDNSGRAVVRKVFRPAEYLDHSSVAGSDPDAANIAAGGDLPLRVYFDLPGISATSFEAYPFYP